MSGWACGEICAEVTWDHVSRQLMIAAIPWATLTGFGVAGTILAPSQTTKQRVRLARYEAGLASSTAMTAAAIVCTHGLHCFIFLVRSNSHKVDPLYHALEMVVSVFVFIDVIFSWLFVMTGGIKSVVQAAFGGQLFTDSVVCTAVISVGIPGPKGDRTWFSFCFMGSLRILRVVRYLQKSDSSSSTVSWRKQIVLNIMALFLFVYACAASIMTLEHLGAPKLAESESELSWDIWSSMFFAFSTIWTIGDNALVPMSVLGRAFTSGLVVWGVIYLATMVAPIIFNLLLENDIGQGRFTRTDRPGGHVIVTGNPTAPMLWDLLVEIYHPNHFESSEAFNQLAPSVVLLVSEKKTLLQLKKYLARRESIMFRHHVSLLRGSVFDREDLARADVIHARRALVLPDLTIADRASDDSQNIMRTFMLCSEAPDVHVVCLLHQCDNGPATLGNRNSNASFLSLDAFKLTLLAQACLTKGACTFVCNLCRTVGGGKVKWSGKQWQTDYERSLGMEVYEVRLADSYDDVPFSDIVEDILARSVDGDVYLIGFTSNIPFHQDADDQTSQAFSSYEPGRPRRSVTLHPGSSYRLPVLESEAKGIFIAPDVSAIHQCRPGDSLLSLDDRNAVLAHSNIFRNFSKSLVSASSEFVTAIAPVATNTSIGPPSIKGGVAMSLDEADEDDANLSPVEAIQKKRKLAYKIGNKTSAEMEEQGEEAGLKLKMTGWSEITDHRLQKEQVLKDKWYDNAMVKIRKRLLVSGFESDVITQVSAPRVDSIEDKYKDFKKEALVSPTALERRQSNVAEYNIDEELKPLTKAQDRKLNKLKELQRVRDRMSEHLVRPPIPPESLMQLGGHLVLCVVGDTTASAEYTIANTPGANLGIENFVRPLRDRLQGRGKVPAKLTGQPPVVILAESLPNDWHRVCETDRLYFVLGSALSLEDLHRTSFQRSRAVAIVRRPSRIKSKAAKVADARVILAASLIEANLPPDTQVQVVTDHAYNGSVDYLPKSKGGVDVESFAQTQSVADVVSEPKFLQALMKGPAAAAGLSQQADQASFGESIAEEDYEKIESSDYARHPRFMAGQVFVESTMTALVANTLYNPDLVPLVSAITQAPMMQIPVPKGWVAHRYADLNMWLLREKNLTMLGLYRSSQAAEAVATGNRKEELDGLPTHYYMFTGPPAYDTTLAKTDYILCLLPAGVQGEWKPTLDKWRNLDSP